MTKLNNRLTWIELQKRVKEANNRQDLIGVNIEIGIIEIKRNKGLNSYTDVFKSFIIRKSL